MRNVNQISNNTEHCFLILLRRAAASVRWASNSATFDSVASSSCCRPSVQCMQMRYQFTKEPSATARCDRGFGLYDCPKARPNLIRFELFSVHRRWISGSIIGRFWVPHETIIGKALSDSRFEQLAVVASRLVSPV